MSATAALETVRRFRDILSLIARGQVRTAYEIAQALDLPTSSTYLAVAELERLSCLTRDESGNLLIGISLQQVALDALGYSVSAQQLSPLVRYLRDRTGETIFVGSLGPEILTVGPIATGFNVGSLLVQPLQTFSVVGSNRNGSADEVFRISLRTQEFQSVSFLGIELSQSSIPGSQDVLAIGAARVGDDNPGSTQLIRSLSDARRLLLDVNLGTGASR